MQDGHQRWSEHIVKGQKLLLTPRIEVLSHRFVHHSLEYHTDFCLQSMKG